MKKTEIGNARQIIVWKGRRCIVVQPTENYYLVRFEKGKNEGLFSVLKTEVEK